MAMVRTGGAQAAIAATTLAVAFVASLTLALCFSPAARAGPTLMFDAASGEVLFADDPDLLWHPASLTKLMTAYVTFEAVKKGEIKLDGDVALSPKARAQPATRVGLRAGIKVNFDQAVRALIMRSANDLAMALAENISGSEDAFVVRMNATARRLGMSRTRFMNPHGLPDIEQVTTARDMGRLTQALQRDFPEYADVFSAPSVAIHKGTFYSHNDLLKTLQGGDGMKTGFTCGAGYNVVASATREGRRIVAIVLGEQNGRKRSARASALIEHGFSTLEWKALAKPASLDTLAFNPVSAALPPYNAGLMRIRRCASRRPVYEPPTPDADDDIVEIAGSAKSVAQGDTAAAGRKSKPRKKQRRARRKSREAAN